MDIAPIYQYVASHDPFTSKAICNKFGYDISQAQTESDVAAGLQEVVAAHGNDALAAVVDIHPDKDLILEVAGAKTTPVDASCDCNKKVADKYVQDASSAVNPIHLSGNTFIIGAVVILGLAIVFSHHSK